MSYPTFRYYYAGGQDTPAVGDGQLLVGNSSGIPTLSNIQAGPGIEVDNGPGSITITAVAADNDHFEIYDVNNTTVSNAMVSGVGKKISFNNIQTQYKTPGFDIATPSDGTITYNGMTPRRVHAGMSVTLECDTNSTVITLYWRESTDAGVTYNNIESSLTSMYYVGNAYGEPVSTAMHMFLQPETGASYQLWAQCSKTCNIRLTHVNAFGMTIPYTIPV